MPLRETPDNTGPRAGDDPLALYLDRAGSHRRLTRQEERDLSARALAGDREAQATLVRHNLLLVVTIAKDFARSSRIPLLDLISAGNEGLIIASRRYDGTRGVPFGNYAPSWIKQRIMRYTAEQGFAVRVPPYRAGVVHQALRAHRRLAQELGRAPSEHELAERMGKPLAETREVLSLLRPAVELDAPVAGNSDAPPLRAFVPDPSPGDEPARRVIDRDLERRVKCALERIDPREARVLELYFGIDRARGLRFDEIGQRLGVSPERARQILSQGLQAVEPIARQLGLQE